MVGLKAVSVTNTSQKREQLAVGSSGTFMCMYLHIYGSQKHVGVATKMSRNRSGGNDSNIAVGTHARNIDFLQMEESARHGRFDDNIAPELQSDNAQHKTTLLLLTQADVLCIACVDQLLGSTPGACLERSTTLCS